MFALFLGQTFEVVSETTMSWGTRIVTLREADGDTFDIVADAITAMHSDRQALKLAAHVMDDRADAIHALWTIKHTHADNHWTLRVLRSGGMHASKSGHVTDTRLLANVVDILQRVGHPVSVDMSCGYTFVQFWTKGKRYAR